MFFIINDTFHLATVAGAVASYVVNYMTVILFLVAMDCLLENGDLRHGP